jgi:hypothetical protein
MSNVLITGAGVDKTAGIDFPLANNLLPEISQFIENEGAEFEKALRKAIPGLRFNFNRFINREIDDLTKKDDNQLRTIVKLIKQAANQIKDPADISKKRGEVIIILFEKLVSIQKSSQIDDKTFELIKDAFGNDFSDDDFIIDIHKVSLSDTFKSILKLTLKESLTTKSNPIADAMASYLLDIEQLLIQKFLGFYNQHIPDVKNYIYIAWCLWGYLVTKQQSVLNDTKYLPFYHDLPDDLDAITLNYTTFLEKSIPKGEVIYFHGGLSEYVRMDTRQLLPISNLEDINIKSFIEEEIAKNLDFSSDEVTKHKHVIPSLVPPLKLKPVLSNKYIETWAKASDLVHQAEKVIVVGYSFNNADEHFNDIIRNGGEKKYDIITPDVLSDLYMERIEKVFDVSLSNFTDTNIHGLPAKTNSKIRLIKAKAEQINIKELLN